MTFVLALALLAATPVSAQRFGRSIDLGNPRASQHSGETPTWSYAPGFEKDVFTFVRIIYGSAGRSRRSFGNRWLTDWPDADVNLAWRLQQMTSMKVDPNGRCLEITDPEIFRYPFIYIVEPGDLAFSDEEVPILRRYLLNGGFLMLDDFWGEAEWEGMAEAMQRVFPDRPWEDLPRSHGVFHCVFDLPDDLNLQCPNINLGEASQYNGGITWERADAQEVHIRGIKDDKGRLCVIACHNTDNGDGWEREGESQYYFREFSEKKAYPLGINIIFYSMTH
jgi:hypothetical protein